MSNLLVMFADISGSMRLYELLGDVAARGEIASCLDTLTAIVKRHRGQVIKIMGDEVMSIFSIVEEGVAAVCEMHLSLEGQSVEHRGSRLCLPIHAGMHYGPVLLEGGDVFGDTVNMAKRLTGIAKARQTVTTRSVVAKLPPRSRGCIRHLDYAPVKGKKDPIDIFEVIWQIQDRRSELEGLPGTLVRRLVKDIATRSIPNAWDLN
jgi:adenylate cyclase